jgi:hypothetical protein
MDAIQMPGPWAEANYSNSITSAWEVRSPADFDIFHCDQHS